VASMSRRVQHYGYRFDYSTRSVDLSNVSDPFPSWIEFLIPRLRPYYPDGDPDQCTIQEYLPGKGVSPFLSLLFLSLFSFFFLISFVFQPLEKALTHMWTRTPRFWIRSYRCHSCHRVSWCLETLLLTSGWMLFFRSGRCWSLEGSPDICGLTKSQSEKQTRFLSFLLSFSIHSFLFFCLSDTFCFLPLRSGGRCGGFHSAAKENIHHFSACEFQWKM